MEKEEDLPEREAENQLQALLKEFEHVFGRATGSKLDPIRIQIPDGMRPISIPPGLRSPQEQSILDDLAKVEEANGWIEPSS